MHSSQDGQDIEQRFNAHTTGADTEFTTKLTQSNIRIFFQRMNYVKYYLVYLVFFRKEKPTFNISNCFHFTKKKFVLSNAR